MYPIGFLGDSPSRVQEGLLPIRHKGALRQPVAELILHGLIHFPCPSCLCGLSIEVVGRKHWLAEP